MNVYQAPILKELEDYYGSILYAWEEYPLLKDHLAQIAEKLWEGISAGKAFLLIEISNHHSTYLGLKPDEFQGIQLKKEDCYYAIAREYGFANWAALAQSADLSYDLLFEQAVQDLLGGDLPALKEKIEAQPSLINQTSAYGHRATLLHYGTSNGVEIWRQKVPFNLPDIIRYLLEKGADPQAKMKVYGGAFDPLALLVSSAHPYEAGLGAELERILREAQPKEN